MTFNVQLAMAIAFLSMLIRPLSNYFGWAVADEEASPLIRWYRQRGYLAQGVLDGILAAIIGISFERWITLKLHPAINAGGLQLGITIILNLIAIGLGLSVGKHITHSDYRAVRRKQ